MSKSFLFNILFINKLKLHLMADGRFDVYFLLCETIEILQTFQDAAMIDKELAYYTNFYTISAKIDEWRRPQIKTSMPQNPWK